MTSKRLRYNRITVPFASQPWRSWLAVGVLLALLWLLRDVLLPFAIAGGLAYVLMPLHHRLSRRINPGWSATITLCIALAAVILIAIVILPLFVRQTAQLITSLPRALNSIDLSAIPWLNNGVGDSVSFDMRALEQWLTSHAEEVGQVAGKILPTLSAGGMAVLTWLVNLALIPLVMFYAIRDGHAFADRCAEWVPPRWLKRLRPVARDIDHVMGEFLRGQLLVMLLMSAFYSILLSLVGLDYALPVGLVAGLLVFIPYVGSTLALVLASLSAWLQFGVSTDILWVWGIFAAGQMVEGFIVTPLLVGDRIGLHPVLVILGLMAFGHLFGFVGILLALPASAILLVAMRHLKPVYRRSRFYRG